MKRLTLKLADLHALDFDYLLVASSGQKSATGKKLVAHVSPADGEVGFYVYRDNIREFSSRSLLKAADYYNTI